MSSAIGDACRLLCERSRDPVVIFDKTARCVAANAAAAALLGYESAEFPGLRLAEVLIDGSGRSGPALSRIDAAGEWSGLLTVRRKDGDLLAVDAWVTELADATDAALVLLLRQTGAATARFVSPASAAPSSARSRIANDLTRLEADNPVTAAASRDALLHHFEGDAPFRAAFAAASIGMALVMPDGSFLKVNPALCTMLGYHEDALLRLTLPEVTHVADLETDRDLARQLLSGEIESYQIEKRYIRQDGETIWGRLTVALVRDLERSPLYFVAQLQDITPYKAFGAALREAEARYRTLVEQIPAVLYIDAGDALGTASYVSPQIETLLGYSPDEWLATPEQWAAHLHPDDREPLLAAHSAANESGFSPHLEYRLIARDGSTVWVRDQPILARDETGARRYWQGFIVDITARKRVEEDLRRALAAAEEANRLKSAFLSMATHELRTPLTVISGYIELLAEAASTRLGGEEQEFLDIVRTSAATLTALVDDLLDLARIEAGRLELVIRPVDVAEAVMRVRRMVAAQAAAKGIDVEIDATPNLPLVAADLNRLVQVLLNLFGNAIKFTEEGQVRGVVRAKSGGVEVRVIDTGIGIPSEALPRIFDEFRQADAGTTRKFGGSGLGLAIAKRLIEMQGGSIGVTSQVGVGSTFSLWLPAATAQLLRDDRMTLDASETLPPPGPGVERTRSTGTVIRTRRTASRRA